MSHDLHFFIWHVFTKLISFSLGSSSEAISIDECGLIAPYLHTYTIFFLLKFIFLKKLQVIVWYRFFLRHRSQRLQWPIVITRCPASVRQSSVRQFTFSISSPEALDGFWWNLVWMKYSRSLTSVVVFRPDPPRADPGRGKNRSRGVPFFNKLLLQTGRLQQQTEYIAVI